MQPIDLAAALLDLRLAVSGQVAQLADRFGWHEVRAQQPSLDQPAQPLSITNVGLAARDLLDMTGVDKQTLELVLQDRPRRLPVHAAGLDRDMRHAEPRQPVAQRQESPHRRRELLHVLLAGNPHAGRHRRLVNIQRR